jgi:hypothetical protein
MLNVQLCTEKSSFFSFGLQEDILLPLKVHKIENFMVPILNFVLFHC